jgi:hypothetical protein
VLDNVVVNFAEQNHRTPTEFGGEAFAVKRCG